jgi:serine/threonine protein kinase
VTTTRTGLIRGSISYLSPEQARGDRPDGRSDLFSLGSVLHELLTGKRLFDQSTEASRLGAILYGEISTVRAVKDDVPAALDEAVMWALQREANKRPASAAALSQALEQSIAPAKPWGNEELAEWLQQRLNATVIDKSQQIQVFAEPIPPPPMSLATPPPPSMPSLQRRVTEPEVPSAATTLPWQRIVIAVSAIVSVVVIFLIIDTLRSPATVASAPAPMVIRELPKPAAPPPPEPVIAVAAPAPEPVAVAKPSPPPRPKMVPAAPKAPTQVYVTIDSRPGWATVSIDGKEIGPTPLVRVPLLTGMHQLTAVTSDGKRKSSRLKLVDGKDEKVLLEW